MDGKDGSTDADVSHWKPTKVHSRNVDRVKVKAFNLKTNKEKKP